MPGGIIRHYYPICPNIRGTGTVCLDTIIAVANRVHRHLLYHELGIFPVRLEDHLRPNRNVPNGDKGRNDNKTGISGTGQRNTSRKICTTTWFM